MPVASARDKSRALLNTVPYLQKNGSNYKNAIKEVGVNVKNNPNLDRAKAADKVGYCVFGRVVDGMDVVDKIRMVKTGSS